MPRKKIKTDLFAFVKKECANYDYYYDVCHYAYNEPPCAISESEPCNYFEKVLLPIAKQQGKYDKLSSLYSKIKRIKKQSIRVCKDCGKEVAARKQYCESCIKQRRKEAYLKQKRK